MKTCVILLSACFIISFSSCATHVSTRLANVTIVKSAPKHHKIVRVKGKSYYFWNGKHYKKTLRGFVFVRV